MIDINETHDPNLRSWVESANDPDTDFPIQNLPFGVFRKSGDTGLGQIGIAIGNQIFDVAAGVSVGVFSNKGLLDAESGCGASLNYLMNSHEAGRSSLRQQVSQILREDAVDSTARNDLANKLLVSMNEVEMRLPGWVGNYTDFYASVYHATNIGRMFRPDQPLMPNYKWVPIGYHGRASSIVPSGTPIRRPSGQTMADGADAPTFGPSKVLDYELEVGLFVGRGNEQGQPIPIAEAEDHVFGLCLVNDWSARDIQRWEYQPLGPFLAKSFATTISPWVVTLEALAPFRAPAFERDADDPRPLPYLDSSENCERGGFDINLEVLITTEQMRAKGIAPHRLSASNTKDLYWTFAQMLTHHTSNGCNLRPGDLLASGTVSGATKDSQGSLMEITERGAMQIQLPTGETRKFLQDGDEVVLRGYCQREGFRRIGFGECTGRILSATSFDRI